MNVDRRKFFASVGGMAAVAAMSHEDRAEALEHFMTDELDRAPRFGQPGLPAVELQPPRGTGNLFTPQPEPFDQMPAKPTLIDFFNQRFAPARHVLQSATHAMETGQPERIVFACLIHDVTQNLIKADHGYWGAQLFAPYVDERVSWAVKYHQALRFFPDQSVGYEYPDAYNRIFGQDYEPDQYIKADYEFARNHRYYMEARLVTVNDQYAFDPDARDVKVEEFTDIIGRQFKQPKEGIGLDNSPVAHMWRSIINPDRPL